MSIQAQRYKHSLKLLNQKFHTLSIEPYAIYKELLLLRVDIQRSLLINLYPDSGNTYCGSLIDQRGVYKSFDLDCDNSELSILVTQASPTGKSGRYFDLAKELYLELRNK